MFLSASYEKIDGMWHFNTSSNIGMVISMILWGVLHGLTPHGHSWLVLLPFALGGIGKRGMLRMSLAYSFGIILTAAVTGALLGWLSSHIPNAWHANVELGIGLLLLAVGLSFLFKPLSIHHAIDHICSEECASGEEKKLVRTGTTGAMFMLGVMSMLIPCPTILPVYTLLVVTHSAAKGVIMFTIYALATALAINLVAVSMVHARGLVTALDQKSGYRLLVLRLSGILVLAIALWMLWMSLHPQMPGMRLAPVSPIATTVYSG